MLEAGNLYCEPTSATARAVVSMLPEAFPLRVMMSETSPSWDITNRYWTFASTSCGVTRTAHEGTLSAPEAM